MCRPDTSVDMLLGTGGTPEGVIAAAALKCMGGTLQGRLAPRNDDERKRAIELGYNLDRILFVEDLCKGEQVHLSAFNRSTQHLRLSFAFIPRIRCLRLRCVCPCRCFSQPRVSQMETF